MCFLFFKKVNEFDSKSVSVFYIAETSGFLSNIFCSHSVDMHCVVGVINLSVMSFHTSSSRNSRTLSFMAYHHTGEGPILQNSIM
jgi:hypothetical protein